MTSWHQRLRLGATKDNRREVVLHFGKKTHALFLTEKNGSFVSMVKMSAGFNGLRCAGMLLGWEQ